MLDVVAIGDICVDFLTPPLKRFTLGDRQLWLPTLPMVPGGNAANFALGCAALGLRSGLAACLGGDSLSGYLAEALRRGRVVSFVKVRKALEAGRTFALNHVGGSRQLLTYNGSNLALMAEDIPEEIVHARHVHRAGYWWTPRLQGKPTRDLLKKARDGGAETSLDLSTDPEGWPDSRRAKVLSVLPQVSIFFGNEAEVRGVFDTRDLRTAARETRALGVEVTAVHRGARGCSVFSRDGRIDVPGFPVPPRNPTGTGDLFNAGFVYGRLEGYDARRCATFANAVAARHLEGPEPYPSRAAVTGRFPLR